MTTLTQATLNAMGCGNPKCTTPPGEHTMLCLSAGCHPEAGLEAVYFKNEGVLQLECKECGECVAHVAVAGATQ